MTDDEIIKYLEQAIDKYNKNEIFVDNIRLDKLSLDLIKRQQAEIERLEKIRKADNNLITSLNKCYETAKAEAYKEFISCATDLCYKEFENDLEVAHTFASILTEAQKEMGGEE